MCSVNSRKLPALGFKGYIGIGFKSIFRVTDEVEIHSGEFHFKFSKSEWRGIYEERGVSISQVPWEVLPVEIAPKVLPTEYLTGFYVPLAQAKARSVYKEINDFLSTPDFPKEAILLLDSVKEIRLVTPGGPMTITKTPVETENLRTGTKTLAKVTKENLSNGLSEEASYQIYRKVVSVPKPTKDDTETERVRRSDVNDREIGLIFGEGPDNSLDILQGKLTGVYSFLPIEGEQTGLPFGTFGDFIPQPGRDLINYGAAWNQWMCNEVATCFEQVTRDCFIQDPQSKDFPLRLLIQVRSGSTNGPGEQFWNTELRRKIKTFLESEALHPDAQGSPTILEGLMAVDPLLLKVVGHQSLESIFGRKLIHPSISELIPKRIDVFDMLQEEGAIGKLSLQPESLGTLYGLIADRSDYYVQGGQGRYKPLSGVPFVLGADGTLYGPNQLMLLQTELDSVPAFLRAVIPADKVPLHPAIASDDTAVTQLARCGLEVVDIRTVISRLAEIIRQVTQSQNCPPEWQYPDDLIRATLFVEAHGGPRPERLVAENDTLELGAHLFVPGATLDWASICAANLLPGFQPAHPRYLQSDVCEEFGLDAQRVRQYFSEIGLHGFDRQHDRGLTETAAFQFAEKKEATHGHIMSPVMQRNLLGFDYECAGHCQSVFEIKGQAEPRDEDLPESETDAAKLRAEHYVLVFVYNLPSAPENIGYKAVRNPKTIFVAIDRARAPRDAWLAHQ